MIIVKPYTTIRVKLLEACQLRCNFCHHEGNALARSMRLGEVLEAVARIRAHLPLEKVHLTGGEPTLYPELLALVDALSAHQFRVALTTHGGFGDEMANGLVQRLKDGRVCHVNVSLHTLDAARHAARNGRPTDARARFVAGGELRRVAKNIERLAAAGDLRINCVVDRYEADLDRVVAFAADIGAIIRLVPDWTDPDGADRTIVSFLRRREAQLQRFEVVRGTSNYAVAYDVGGHEVQIKLIRSRGLLSVCSGCNSVDRCTEYFGNLRLEGSPPRVRMCMHHEDTPHVESLDGFLAGDACRELARLLIAEEENVLGLVEPLESRKASLAIKSADRARLHEAIGARLLEQDDAAGAERAYRAAIDWDPASAVAHSGLAHALFLRGSLIAALLSARTAVACSPDLALAHRNVGYLLCDLGRPNEAVGAFERAIALDPDRPHAWYACGRAEEQRGDAVKAEGRFQAAIERDQNYLAARVALAGLYRRQGRSDTAQLVASIRQNISYARDFTQARFAASCGDVDEAFRLLELTFGRAPGYRYSAARCPQLRTLRSDRRWRAIMVDGIKTNTVCG